MRALACLFLIGLAAADETIERAAEGVLAAADDAALKALAGKDEPDPWLVADELCYRGEHDAAERFANAAGRDALAAYVASRRGQKPDAGLREAWARLREGGEPGDPPGPLDTVARIRLAAARGIALGNRKRFDEAAVALAEAGRAAEALGWLECATACFHNSATASFTGSDFAGAAAASLRELNVLRRIDDRALIARALARLGTAEIEAGDHAGASAHLGETVQIYRGLSDKRRVAQSLSVLGEAKAHLGHADEARAHFDEAFEILGALGDAPGAIHLLINVGYVYETLVDYDRALSHYGRALKTAESLPHPAFAAEALRRVGRVHMVRGDLGRARACCERAVGQSRAAGDARGVVGSLVNLGVVHVRLGAYAEALAAYEEGLAVAEKAEDAGHAAMVLMNIGVVYGLLGDAAAFRSFTERALRAMEALGDKRSIPGLLVNIGLDHADRGELDKALACYERGLELAEKYKRPEWVANALVNIAAIHGKRGEHEEGAAVLRRALERREARGDRLSVAEAHVLLGRTEMLIGRRDDAVARFKRAVRTARSLRATAMLAYALGSLAQAHLEAGENGEALRHAESARRELELVLGGLGEEEGATARAGHAEIFEVGALAAARLEEPAEVLAFLESGRAGALRESLGGRQALRWTALPEDLRAAEAAATAREGRARDAYRRAVTSNRRKDIRAAAEALDAARDGLRVVQARIQREAKRQAGLWYPRAASIEEVQDSLAEDQALVVYALCLDEALAMVIRPNGGRVVALGKADDVRAACAALDPTDPTAEPALKPLRDLLVAPLRLEAQRLIVSPDGPLGYLPFGALLDRPVALTPSGSTHVLLAREVGARGKGVLALGDPDYAGLGEGAVRVYARGRALAPLPATRAEAKAVGDHILLGADANEEELRAALATRPRWRAVHLACHGLVDPERPTLSSLALAATTKQDGFLTAMEVLRMEIPADLAVLSACETGKGKIVSSEGIVGLTRAFMYAGAPRVICSLWKVDDETTRALMVKFYQAWKPGVGAAAALRQAQDHIRKQEKWRHPYYWAAWVLWGLPD